MSTQTLSDPASEGVSLGRLLWVGPLAILVTVIANVIIQQIAVAVLRPDPLFMPLTIAPPVIFSVIGVLGAVIVFALMGRFSSRPVSLFKRVALVVLLVSLVPEIAMLLTGFNPDTTPANVFVLMLLHVVAWAISVWMLTNLARE